MIRFVYRQFRRCGAALPERTLAHTVNASRPLTVFSERQLSEIIRENRAARSRKHLTVFSEDPVLTDAALKALKPKDKGYKVTDRDGMYVYVTPGGTITFRLDYRLNGRRETLQLGRYGRGRASDLRRQGRS